MAKLSLKNIDKIYPNTNAKAVDNFNLDIADGEFVVLVGSSGCGKSTTLRMVAGLEEISSGQLFIDDKNVTNAAPKDRDIAMVFQNYALYPQMTVYQNLAFSLILSKQNKEEIHKKVMDTAEILGLKNQLNKTPNQLSGGQRQRVAVGRAIVRKPKVFLFDEPLSNLDAKLRNSMRHELKILHQQLKSTMIYVTHDQIEALTLADRIVVMSYGVVQQVGTPLQLYQYPDNLFVASFIGLPQMNFFDVMVTDGKLKSDEFEIKLSQQHIAVLQSKMNENIILGVRPEDVQIGIDLDFCVNIRENLGQYTLLHGTIGNTEKKAVFKLFGWTEQKSGEKLKLSFNSQKMHFFDARTKKAIR
ncbi:MAG: ABC transporter ATP-binding protein [Clostridiales bacterium]|jgi:multiple sugar transport system ATP-binding protein|nr:ABC transporter ATP-binding protein [Clostridiales bacterium]